MNLTNPTWTPSSLLATGRLFYEFLMRNIRIPASANHEIWYAGEAEKIKRPYAYAFRGDIPVGQTLELVSLMGVKKADLIAGQPVGLVLQARDFERPIGPLMHYAPNGTESYILVGDLSDDERIRLMIPGEARDKEKVFNANFKPYDRLPEMTRWSNELAALSVPKSISSYLAGVKGKVNYSERDVLRFLEACFNDMSGPEMMHVLHGNHLAWASLAYMRENGNVSGDILAEFHGQNPADFFTKDLGTVLPTLYFALANLGQDPVMFHAKLGYEVYGSAACASEMRKYMSAKGADSGLKRC